MTLGDDYPKQQERCRTILGHAKELPKVSGWFLVASLEDLLRRADRAAIEQDLPAMIRIYEEMKEVKE
jgi:hypothetical protein